MESLGIDIKLLIAQIINFVLFFLIFKRFVSTPFSNFLNIEKRKEEEKEKILQEVKRKEEDIIAQELKAKERMKKEYEAAVKSAKLDAQKVREDLLGEAKGESETIVERGRRQIGEEKETMHKEVKAKIADLSIFIVNKVLSQYLNEQMKKNITREILKNLPR